MSEGKHVRENWERSYPVSLQIKPEQWLRFVQLTPFDRKWKALGFDDNDLRLAQLIIMSAPRSGKVIGDTNGLRKIRLAKKGGGKSKGIRVCYVYFDIYGVVYLVALFAKNEKDDLSDKDKSIIAKWISRLEAVLEKGNGDEIERT